MIPNENMKTQQYINSISEWTKENKMLLNKKKCNAMIFKFCRDYQFTSKILIKNEEMEIVSQTNGMKWPGAIRIREKGCFADSVPSSSL